MADEKKKEAPPAAPAPSKGGSAIAFIVMFMSAVLAGGAAFLGAKFASAQHPQKVVEVPSTTKVKAPGPTTPPQTFKVAFTDSNKKLHAMQITFQVEFKEGTGEEALKEIVPRIRAAALPYFSGLTYEEASDKSFLEKAGKDLMVKFKEVGATDAEQALITDFIVQ